MSIDGPGLYIIRGGRFYVENLVAILILLVDAAFAAAALSAIGPQAAAVAGAVFSNGDRSGDDPPNGNDQVESNGKHEDSMQNGHRILEV